MTANTGAQKLRQLLDDQEYVFAPGTSSPLEAQIAELTGHEAVYVSGAATNVCQFGYFDGLVGMSEMAESVGRIARSTDLPVLADADTGYGGVHNVQRTVREYDRAGIAALQIEDQRWPKRCGHAAGKEVVSRADARARFQAAVDARDEDGRDIVIIGRTDAYGSANGDWEEHVARGRMLAEVGVDLVMPEMPDPTRENAVRFAEAIHETHPEARFVWNYSSNFAWTDQDDPLTFAELGGFGYSFMMVSLFGMHAAAHALYEHLKDFATNEEEAQWRMEEKWAGHEEFEKSTDVFFRLGNFAEYQEIEERYLEDAEEKYARSEGYQSES
jgi:isocitrate lyase